jgi:hypothetical protein
MVIFPQQTQKVFVTVTMTKEKGGISSYNLMIHKIMKQKYKTKKKGDKIVYDIQTALEKDELVKKYYKDRSSAELSDILIKIDKATKERYIRIIEPEDHPEGYVREKDVFGNIDSFNSLWDETRELIERGASFKEYSRRLQRKYHQHKEIIRDIWDRTLKDYKESR